jgi:predicted ATPase/DNA-binding CsgD family transcriptional regulator
MDSRSSDSSGAAGPADAPPSNLPSQPTSFVGRTRELAEASRALADTRLLTLTGTGGCGKTRLALQLVANRAAAFPDGTWWIDLAPLSEERLVGAAIAEALGVRPLPGFSELQAACAHLAPRRALVVLDNCEHLLTACAEAAEGLLGSGDGVTVTATSREPLASPGEVAWRVPSLTLPGATDGQSIEALRQSDAARLFIERATSARPGFAVTADNAPAIARICAELDGMPLAIELAAARIRVLTAEQIADALADRFRLLRSGDGTARPRQQTLRASIDWSYELLSEEERALLRRLSVFAGGCNLEAVEAICTGDGVDRYDTLDLLASLVEKSLVTVEEHGRIARYRLLESVRQYGLERLEDARETDALRAAHCEFFVAVVEAVDPLMGTAREPEALAMLDPEAANITAATEWAIANAPRDALRLCAALFLWWRATGRFIEAEDAYARSLAASQGQPPQLIASVLSRRSFMSLASGNPEAAMEQGTEALALAEAVGDHVSAADSLCGLGLGMGYADPATGRVSLNRAVELARAAGADWALANAYQFLALGYLFQDDHPNVLRFAEESTAFAVRSGDVILFARNRLAVGSVHLLDGRLSEARDTFAEAIAAGGDAPEDRMVEMMWIDAQFALIDLLAGKPDRALERLETRLQVAITKGAGIAIPAVLTWATWAELALGRPEQARQRVEATISIVDGRDCLLSVWCHWLLAEALRLLGDDGAEAAAERTREVGQKSGNRLGETRGDMTLARLAAARGDWTLAERHALTHLDVIDEGGHATFLPYCLDALAEVTAGLQSNEESTRLFGAAERAREELGVARWTREEAHWDAIGARLRAALGDEEFERAWTAGSELSPAEATAWARRARGSRKRPPSGWESLTPTETRVVELVAEGLTNPQIAERMFVSRATVKVHLAHVFQKLDVINRTELAAQAVQRRT